MGNTKLEALLHGEQDRIILWLPVLFALGIGVYFYLPYEPDTWFSVGISLFFIISALLFRKVFTIRILFIALFIVSLGMLRIELRTKEVAAPVLQEKIFHRLTEGKITDIKNREKGDKLILENVIIEGLPEEYTPEKISVSLKQKIDNLEVGDKIQLYAILFPPPTPVMPRAYDFSRMFYYEQLGAVGYSPKPPVIIEKNVKSGFEQYLNKLRLDITKLILAPMSEENGWIAAAMMTGEQSGVSDEASEALRGSGLYHVLSISGLHMSLAAMIVYSSLRFLLVLYPAFALRFPVKKIAAGVGLVSAFIYLLLAGYPVPAIRSFIMVACVMLAIIFDRLGISIFSLAWAVLIILLWQPEALLGASFQLSFAATIAILAFYEHFSHLLYERDTSTIRKIKLYFLGIILTSLVATIATTPFVIYHFNRFTLWGIAANMLMLPLAGFWIMPCAVLAFLAMPLGLEYYPLIALEKGISFMMSGARFFASLPYSSISIPSLSFFGLILVIFGGLWLCIWHQKWRILGIPVFVAGIFTIFLHKPYDIIINNDAGKVALRLEDGNFIFLRGKEDSFDGQVFLRSHGKEKAVDIKATDPSKVICEKNKCTTHAYGKKTVVTKGKKNIEKSCNGNPNIVISGNYLANIEECKNTPLLIDENYLHKNGATTLRFNNKKIEIETAKEHRGNRPWVR